MGNYEDHVQYGHIAFLLFAIGLGGAIVSGGIPLFWGGGLLLLSYPLVRVGAAFPDVDHHASKPHKMFRRVMFVVGTVASFFVLSTQTLVSLTDLVAGLDVGLSVEAMAAILIHVASLTVGLLARAGVSHFRPKHRGVTHRVPTGVAITSVIAALIGYVLTTVGTGSVLLSAGVLSGAFFVGFLSHLQCDGMLLPALRAPLVVGVRLSRRFRSR